MKAIAWSLAFSLIFCLAFSSQGFGESPLVMVEEDVKALFTNDLGKNFEHLSSIYKTEFGKRDQEITKSDWIQQTERLQKDRKKKLVHAKIKAIKISEALKLNEANKAIALVYLKAETFEALRDALKARLERCEEQTEKILEENGKVYLVVEGHWALIKENGEWKIYNFALFSREEFPTVPPILCEEEFLAPPLKNVMTNVIEYKYEGGNFIRTENFFIPAPV